MIINSVQYYYKKITRSNISKTKVKKFYLPIIQHINDNKFNKFLIAGPQGIGKTTILKIIKKVFKKEFKKEILSLSLDDFYYDPIKRNNLSKKIHPLLNTRGVPGTHDVNYLQSVVNKFTKSKYPIEIPIFDKLNDKKERKKIIIKKKCDILILEGWCVGCPPLNQKYLIKDINLLEKKMDTNKIWRYYYNNQLKLNYKKLFSQFDSIIYFKNSSFSHVLKWRLKQENRLRKIIGNNKFVGMSKDDIKIFIQYYEKITKWMMKVMPKKANLTIFVDINQKIKKLIF